MSQPVSIRHRLFAEDRIEPLIVPDAIMEEYNKEMERTRRALKHKTRRTPK